MISSGELKAGVTTRSSLSNKVSSLKEGAAPAPFVDKMAPCQHGGPEDLHRLYDLARAPQGVPVVPVIVGAVALISTVTALIKSIKSLADTLKDKKVTDGLENAANGGRERFQTLTEDSPILAPFVASAKDVLGAIERSGELDAMSSGLRDIVNAAGQLPPCQVTRRYVERIANAVESRSRIIGSAWSKALAEDLDRLGVTSQQLISRLEARMQAALQTGDAVLQSSLRSKLQEAKKEYAEKRQSVQALLDALATASTEMMAQAVESAATQRRANSLYNRQATEQYQALASTATATHQPPSGTRNASFRPRPRLE